MAERRLEVTGVLTLPLALTLAVGAMEPSGLAAVLADPRRDAAVAAVQQVMPAVVNVATETVVAVQDPLERLFRDFFDPYYRRRPPNMQHSLGSGVIIDEEGYVLTNFHVVNRASRIWVKFHDGREYECERVAENPQSEAGSRADLALLKIRGKAGEKFTAVKFAGDDDLLLGETVLALGNPFGLGGSVSRGILSSKSRRPPAENEPMDVLDWLQTDAAINPGNSGGPLVNLRGELIGINVAIYREGQGIGFAIPVKRVAAALSEIYSPEALDSLWFGATVRPGASPLEVLSVQMESPAGKAGLRAGDQIYQVNGKSPRGFIDFVGQLREARDRQEVKLLVHRGEARRVVTVRMVPEKTFYNADLIRRKLGVTLEEASDQVLQSIGLRTRALVIKEVQAGSAAAAAELERGMMITALDGQATDTVVKTAKWLHGKTRGEKVRLELLVPRRRGAYVQYLQGTVELTL